MQLRDIQYVVTIADMQSFSKAAEHYISANLRLANV